MKSTWKKYLLYAAYTLLASGLLYGLLQLILSGYAVDWTGFQTKTLWDWMDLLIIPIVLALGAFVLNRSERTIERENANVRAKLEREIAKDRQLEETLQKYIERISELLLREKLRTTKKKEVRDIAKTLTISVMNRLDAKRNNFVIQFLREANIITDKYSILNGVHMNSMDLNDTDLSRIFLQKAILIDMKLEGLFLANAHLEGASLHSICVKEAFLSYANLDGANLSCASLKKARFALAQLVGSKLRSADLEQAYFERANMERADFSFANLKNAILDQANLESANFTEANLMGASIDNANLKGAQVTPEQLAQAKSLKGTIMPDGTIHE